MANSFKVNTLLLSQQNLVATGTTLYLNSIDITAASGESSWSAANNNSINLSGNNAATGTILINNQNNISGYANRKAQLCVPFNSCSTITLTSQANAVAFFANSQNYITQIDLLQYTGVKLVVNQGTAGATSGSLYLGYLGNFSTTAANYLNIDSNNTRTRMGVSSNIISSGWQPLVAGAKSGVYIALLMSSGNGSASPTFGSIMAYFQ